MTSSSPYDPPDPSDGPDAARPGRRRTVSAAWPAATPRARARRRRTAWLGLVLVLAAGTGVALVRAGDDAGVRARTGYGAGAAEVAPPTRYPRTGGGSFTPADGETPVHGLDGPLRRYRVAVEAGTGQDAAAFAATVDAVLADRRGWTAGGALRVQRVADVDAADFTVYLATPDTSERMCAEGGLSTEGYTSCRLPGRVVINLARWMEAVPDYGAPLSVYREYVVNHEVGHEFGEGHEACPGPGEPAPVMQQQTYGLDGCAANAWPFVDGSRYAGEPIDGV
ncbi:DUF3152 domain-containing protein [Micromonospora endolithica]|uniref:DUF3152 domain-containing protein n=1 Tax=Micromonospora endolithica TaxID=230091 RepID=A0A3A9Z8V3_9ACTN|nr:DUF3152 domain-containing protein [Micromonospora endolithica]RKN44274.1 DUF3152 domain-containing protein [Micromonospora endolithica]TWJ25745.1 uncharacterized protein DUF3152 [Micromonospora endolithica]